jgi:hypothetical protein
MTSKNNETDLQRIAALEEALWHFERQSVNSEAERRAVESECRARRYLIEVIRRGEHNTGA